MFFRHFFSENALQSQKKKSEKPSDSTQFKNKRKLIVWQANGWRFQSRNS